ncbi:MAG TPA: DUF309 domain-containing protein [bacterium]|nr:DUF309 domain-containing protein [bacterium]
MYVRLKHTLSALALEALRGPARNAARAGAVWLVAFCDLVTRTSAAGEPAGFDVPASVVKARARRAGAGAAGLRRVLDAGLLVRNDGRLSLPEGFRPHFAYMNRQVHRLAAAIRAVDRAARGRGRRDERVTIATGVAMFNAGLFFECHEFLEATWRVAPPADRAFYHGIILIAAAFYHYEKGNLHGTRIKLTQGIKTLQPYLPQAHDVRLDRWMAALAPWRNLIEAGQVRGILNPSEIPRIPMTRARGGS